MALYRCPEQPWLEEDCIHGQPGAQTCYPCRSSMGAPLQAALHKPYLLQLADLKLKIMGQDKSTGSTAFRQSAEGVRSLKDLQASDDARPFTA